MITSKQILELWKITDISRYGQEVDIYENPTSSDFLEMTKKARDEKRPFAGIRFVTDNRVKKVYVADSYGVTHEDIRKIMKLPANLVPYCLDGIATISGGRAIMSSFYKDFSGSGMAVLNLDWSWVDPYIKGCSSVIKSYKGKF